MDRDGAYFSRRRCVACLWLTRSRANGQGMNPLGEFLGQYRINCSVHVHAAFASKGQARNIDREMRLSALSRSAMTGMMMGIIGYR